MSQDENFLTMLIVLYKDKTRRQYDFVTDWLKGSAQENNMIYNFYKL